MAGLRNRLAELPGERHGDLIIAAADDFAYVDPVDGSVSENQGLRILFEGGSRVVYRLSGTGTSGATLRVYIERYEPADGVLDADPAEALSTLVEAGKAIADIEGFTGRTVPDVAT
jgi:phosphoglucomutase